MAPPAKPKGLCRLRRGCRAPVPVHPKGLATQQPDAKDTQARGKQAGDPKILRRQLLQHLKDLAQPMGENRQKKALDHQDQCQGRKEISHSDTAKTCPKTPTGASTAAGP